jgi:hypothetical protein
MEDPAEPVSPAYVQIDNSPRIGDRIRGGTQRRCLAQGLMGPVPVVEPFVLAQGMPQVAFVPYEAAIEKLVATRLHPPLHDRVHPRHPDTGEHRLDAGLGENLVHEGRELAIPIADQKARPAARILQIHHQVPDRLGDPGSGRVRGGAEHADTPTGMLDDRKDVLALPAESDGLDEIAGQ